MKLMRSITALALGASFALAQAATPAPANDPAKKLPADDNVQAQTQANVRKPEPKTHHKKHKRFKSEAKGATGNP